jgi:hypothetical protein
MGTGAQMDACAVLNAQGSTSGANGPMQPSPGGRATSEDLQRDPPHGDQRGGQASQPALRDHQRGEEVIKEPLSFEEAKRVAYEAVKELAEQLEREEAKS